MDGSRLIRYNFSFFCFYSLFLFWGSLYLAARLLPLYVLVRSSSADRSLCTSGAGGQVRAKVKKSKGRWIFLNPWLTFGSSLLPLFVVWIHRGLSW